MMQRSALYSPLSRPGAVEGDKVEFIIVEINACTQRTGDIYISVAPVGDHRTAGDDIKMLVGSVEQFYLRARAKLFHSDDQSGTTLPAALYRGQSYGAILQLLFQFGLSADNFITLKAQ